MEIKTTTTTVYTIELSDADLGEILADPSAFQAELRMRRNALASTGVNARRSIKLGKARRDPKGGASSVRASTSTKTRVPCKLCGKLLAPKYLALHLRKKHSPDAASVETA